MRENSTDLGRPVRVVVFASGPTLEPAVKEFIYRLERHPEVEFLEAIAHAPVCGWRGVVLDLLKRRKLLVVPLLLARMFELGRRIVRHPLAWFRFQREFMEISDRIRFVANIHAASVVDHVKNLSPDLGLIYGAPFLKPDLFETPHFGTLGIHHGTLPDYRGKKTTFWEMYNRERKSGVTIQRVNAGLDKGDVVRKGEVEIGSRTLSNVWKELEALGMELFVNAILDVKRGTARYERQEQAKGRLYKDPSLRDLLRFHWRQVSRHFRVD